MTKWAVKDMGGEIPRQDPHLLPDSAAEVAINCDLSSGPLDGLPTPELLHDFTGIGGTIRRAYRFPSTVKGEPDAWLPLPSEYSSACLSPLTNDTLHRIYWTNPGAGAYWSTYADIIAGNPPYNLGYIAPDATYQPAVSAVGGTDPTVVPWVDRSYLVTFVDQFGEESQPSLPSPDVAGASDAVWTIIIPTTLPGQPMGKNYPLPVKIRLYRTVTGQSTGAAFYQVHEWVVATDPPPITGYIDATLDKEIIGNLQLISAAWNNPPDKLDGLISMAGGFFVGWTGNTIHFSEPDRPHAWPAGYDITVLFPIVGFGVWQQSLMVMTEGFPSQGSGTSPSGFTLSTINVPEPCISRGSIITDLAGVYYASQNGLVMLNYFGMQNQTLQTMTKNIWLERFSAKTIIACRHRSQYLAITGTGVGFMIDYSEARLGVIELNTFDNAVCVWNDPYSGDAYVIADKIVYRWDSPTTPSLTYRWRSKRFYLPSPANLAACQIHADASILTDTAPTSPAPMDNGDATLDLPTGVNCVFRLYADGVLKFTRNILKPLDIFNLISGYMAYEYQFEIVSRSPIFSVELASSTKELRDV